MRFALCVLVLSWFRLCHGSIISHPGRSEYRSADRFAPSNQQQSYALRLPTTSITVSPPGRRPRSGFVALGDSYSAGIGTGTDGPENDCRQGVHAYPAIIANEFSVSQGGPNSTSFQFLSCTGATTNEIRVGGTESQLDALNGSLPVDFALLSVGGNDLGFFEVMNACIFRFYNLYSGTCETALQDAQRRLDDTEFEETLYIVILQLLNKVKWEKKPVSQPDPLRNRHLAHSSPKYPGRPNAPQWFFITVTGYARFFNDQTDECDEMSLGVWWRGPKLKKELRVRMNAMVQAVNKKLDVTIAKINSQFVEPKVLFVEYDKDFDGHRFCEPGVEEPDYKRDDTYFFLVGGQDNARNETRAKQSVSSATVSPMSELVNPQTCLEPARRSGDWGLLALCYMAIAKAQNTALRPARSDLVAKNSMWYVPTYYGKTFHPRTLGHEAIRSRVYEAWHDAGY